jgi:hypothetical protein
MDNENTLPADVNRAPIPSLHEINAAFRLLAEQREKLLLELESQLPNFKTFDLLAYVSLRNIGINVENYHEGEGGGLAIRVEYLTLLSLINGFRDSVVASPRPAAYEAVCDLLRELTDTVTVERLQRRITATATGAQKELEFLAGGAHLNEFFVRVPGQPHHHERVLMEVFSPFDQELRDKHGFTVDDAIRIANGIHDRCQSVLNISLEHAHAGFSALETLAKRRRSGSVEINLPGLTDATLLEWSKMPNKDLAKRIRGQAALSAMIGIGDDLSFTAADIANRLSMPIAVVEQFLKVFSLEFEKVDKRFRVPTAIHPLKRQPLISAQDRFFAPVPDQVLWAIGPLFEGTLIADATSRQRFTNHRHDWLLGEGVHLLARIMPSLVVDLNLKYPKPGGARGDEAELDALARYDSALFLIEAKGASTRPIGKKGILEPFRDEVEKIVQSAHEQALRAHEHLVHQGEFRRADDSRMTIDTDGISNVFLLGITLEPLGFLTSRMAADNPFAPSKDRTLFAISIYDLMMVADCLEGHAAWFPHYLLRRERVAKQDLISSAEEMDLFCYYMDRGLYHEGPEEFDNADTVMLGTWTDKLDEFYFFERGLRSTPAPLPQPKATFALRQFVQRIENTTLPNRLDAMLAVIDLNEKGRKDFFRLRERFRKKHKRDGRPHDFSMGGNGWGLTYMTGTPDQLRALEGEAYIRSKREESRATKWVLIAETGGSAPLFQEFAVSRA